MTQPRPVIVSNRVPTMDPDQPWSAGGLVSALLPAMQATGDALWFGWSGDTGDADSPVREVLHEGVDYATIDLSEEQLRGYYEEFCNRVLWPMLHGLPDRAAPGSAASFDDYRAVNRRFAQALRPMLREGDLVWIHDYQLMALAEELRDLGWTGRTGYFHHVPVPERAMWERIPHHAELARALASFDRIGVQTHGDARRLRALLDPRAAYRVDAYPVAIDAEGFRAMVDLVPADAPRITEGDVRTVFFGVDRLDYTKGIPQRLEAFGRLIDGMPESQHPRFVQWAPLSRTMIPEYQDEYDAVTGLVARVNEGHDDPPVVLEHESQPPPAVARALFDADVCVVTSVADGMNLVAKEYAAVHSADHPGVLILSDSCGAAEELTDALLVSGADVESIEQAMRAALAMPPAERRERSVRLRAAVDNHDAFDWFEAFLGDLARASTAGEGADLPERVERRLAEFEEDGTIERLWRRDHTLWKPDPAEITDRLGWLDVDEAMAEQAADLRAFAEDAWAEGYTHAVLLGMGGSSLAPRVFASAFPDRPRGVRLIVLDSIVPGAVRHVTQQVEGERTLFIVSSKSGTTMETQTLFDYFWGQRPEGRHFIAISDPRTPLAALGEERGFRRVFANPPDIGGRYSALSYFGLVPAALLGIDLGRLLASAAAMRAACAAAVPAPGNPGARLGAMLGEGALMGRDFLTPAFDPVLGAFGAWVQQLIAESTGKEGLGILPLLDTEPDDLGVYSGTRLMIGPQDAPPVPGVPGDAYRVAAEYYRWEFAVAVAGHILGIHPFDQPDVEASKRETVRLIDAGVPDVPAPSPSEVFDSVAPDGYLAIHAYLPPSAENEARLHAASRRLRERLRVPTEVEFGPSLLHSTGQYHKGGLRRGAFVQVVDADEALPIPGRPYTFEDLKQAQAGGDMLALRARGRPATRVTLEELEAL